jgi:hypothetical protein
VRARHAEAFAREARQREGARRSAPAVGRAAAAERARGAVRPVRRTARPAAPLHRGSDACSTRVAAPLPALRRFVQDRCTRAPLLAPLRCRCAATAAAEAPPPRCRRRRDGGVVEAAVPERRAQGGHGGDVHPQLAVPTGAPLRRLLRFG